MKTKKITFLVNGSATTTTFCVLDFKVEKEGIVDIICY